MKIILSKKNWEEMGRKAGWMKKANVDISEIIKSIKENTNKFWNYGHFCSRNMTDYTLMKSTIEDLVAVYGISEEEAAIIVQSLTHKLTPKGK